MKAGQCKQVCEKLRGILELLTWQAQLARDALDCLESDISQTKIKKGRRKENKQHG